MFIMLVRQDVRGHSQIGGLSISYKLVNQLIYKQFSLPEFPIFHFKKNSLFSVQNNDEA